MNFRLIASIDALIPKMNSDAGKLSPLYFAGMTNIPLPEEFCLPGTFTDTLLL